MESTLNFKSFLAESHKKFMDDVQKTIVKIPERHRALIKDYSFEKQDGNTLKGDKDHVGVIDEKKKKITVAAPWNYGREFTILHEFAHAVWKYLVGRKARKEWSEIVKQVKEKHKESKKDLDQNDEEIFCMSYAQFYSNNKMVKFDYPELQSFIEKLPK